MRKQIEVKVAMKSEEGEGQRSKGRRKEETCISWTLESSEKSGCCRRSRRSRVESTRKP